MPATSPRKTLTDACEPYLFPHAPAASIKDILDRLTPWETRQMLCAFAGTAPARFEAQLLQMWADRPVPTDRAPGASN